MWPFVILSQETLSKLLGNPFFNVSWSMREINRDHLRHLEEKRDRREKLKGCAVGEDKLW